MSPDAASILLKAHLSNITSSLQALESIALLSPSDAALIRSKLPSPDALVRPSSITSPGGSHMGNSPYPPAQYSSGGVNRAPPPVPATNGRRVEAVAQWDYTGNAGDDLSFRKGDWVVVVDDLNPDWWKGHLATDPSPNPRIGLFPSSYVTKTSSTGPTHPSTPTWSEKNSNTYVPPPPQQQMMQPYYAQPPPPQNYQLQPIPQAGPVAVAPPLQPNHQSKFSGMGKVLATSAVGGLGFGAGSAIGGDIIHAIF